MKRVNISISPSRHDSLKQFAADREMSFSQFVRRACEEERHRLENDGISRDLQPLPSELDQINSRLDELDELRDALVEVQHRLEFAESRSQTSREMVAEPIFHLLRNQGQLTLPEILENLDVERSRSEARSGIALLRKEFRIRILEPENPDTGKTRFALRNHDNEPTSESLSEK